MPRPVPDGRASRKSSTTHGSSTSSSSTNSKGKKQNPHKATTDTLPPLGSTRNRRVHLYNDPAPMYKPMLTPGVRGKAGVTAYVGKMYPDRKSNSSPYGFRFHYNPAAIHVSSQSDYNAVNAPTEGDGNNYFYNYGAMDFTILLNRQDEVAAGAKTANVCMGSREFAKLGTMYDLEWMYRVFNSSPDVAGDLGALTQANLYETSISYILKASATHVQFNHHLKYYGWPTSIDIQHQLFTPNMVPTITIVQITLAGLAPQPQINTPSQTIVSGNGTTVRSFKTQNGHAVGGGNI